MKKDWCPHGDYYATCEICYSEWKNKMSEKLMQELLKLDEDSLNKIIKSLEKRSKIIFRINSYKERAKELDQELKDIRSSCDHIAKSEKKIWYEDDYGKMLSTGYYEYICPDCGWRNSVEFDEDA